MPRLLACYYTDGDSLKTEIQYLNANLNIHMHCLWQRAIEEGADFIETDILASEDGHLICFHDVTLDDTTDIANRTEFVGRKRTYEVQGVNMTGWFTGM